MAGRRGVALQPTASANWNPSLVFPENMLSWCIWLGILVWPWYETHQLVTKSIPWAALISHHGWWGLPQGLHNILRPEGHFTHETESPLPFQFKHSHWWKRRSRSKFALMLRLRDRRSMWMQDGCKVYMASKWTMSQRPKSSSKALFKLHFFSWWPLLLCWKLKRRESSWDLQ